MKLLYGPDKYFIGVVKFFDSNKGFGFIASNNCNMDTTQYYQDFYANDESFIDEKAKNENKLVVFQVEQQSRNRTRAVHIRLLSSSLEDYKLRLSYYDTHEKIQLKKGVNTNMYNLFRIPRSTEISNICNIISNDPNRSPESTLNHFTKYVLHFKVDIISDQQFIFERDFDNSSKSAWFELVKVLSIEETLEILYSYPCFSIYISDSQIINKWLDTFRIDNFSICTLDRFKEIINTFTEDLKAKAITKFEDFIEQLIYYKLGISDNKSLFYNSKNWIGKNDLPHETFHGYSKGTHISHYVDLTSRNYDIEIANYEVTEKLKTFKHSLEKLINEPDKTYNLSSLIDAYDKLEDKSIITDDIKLAISELIEHYIIHYQPLQVIELTRSVFIFDEKQLNDINEQLFPIIKKNLTESLAEALVKTSHLSSFIKSYKHLSSALSSNHKDELDLEIKSMISNTSSIDVIIGLCTDELGILSNQETNKLTANIVANWDYNTINQFLYRFNNDSEEYYPVLDIVIEKALSLVSDRRLNESFDTKIERKSYDSIRYNCNYLSKITDLLSSKKQHQLWKQYLSTRSIEEYFTLYDNDIISELPEGGINTIVDIIDKKDIKGQAHDWYSPPKLNSSLYQRIFESADEELFSAIADRLSKLELTNSSIPLAVFFLELLKINKPKDADYYELREWEDQFKSDLDNFLKGYLKNIRLQILSWCIFDTQCKGGMKELQEIFPYLPPYLQIRVVRKFFKFISQGKISHSAESLYDFLTNKKNTICLPLEIVFSYLKLREQDSNATFNNNIMLHILDGRDDYDAWSYVVCLMHACINRWQVDTDDDRWSDRYFNGIIDKLDDERIKVYVPFKMIDEYRRIKEYNNKHFKTISEVIKVTYSKNEYDIISENNATSYIFNSTYEIGLYALSRAFNLKYNNKSEEVSYTRKEDVNTFCECRLSDKLDSHYNQAFHWCSNKPCFRPPIRFMAESEWEHYRLLDFMRILKIPTDYTTRSGKVIKHGHYIIFSSYLKSFSTFYEHMFCRDCGCLLKPKNISNYASAAITEFHCANNDCKNKNVDIYINHCFNKKKCNEIIDSRDSAKCPNGQYICPKCGGCCSTDNFRFRISNLETTGGCVSSWLRDFVHNERGHWERNEYYCYICGKEMYMDNGTPTCNDCNITYQSK